MDIIDKIRDLEALHGFEPLNLHCWTKNNLTEYLDWLSQKDNSVLCELIGTGC